MEGDTEKTRRNGKKSPVTLRRGQRFVREKLHGKSYLAPSFVTVAAIFCGFLAIISALKGNFLYSARCILVAGILDGLDGRIARRLNATSEFGREFDSLSDVMSFGVAPAVLVYCWAFSAVADEFGVLVSFLFVVCSATRLARFNVQAMAEDTTSGFTGMPTPAAAGCLFSLVLCFPAPVRDPWLVAAVMLYTVFVGFLMVSTLPFFSIKKLKFSSGNPRLNAVLLAAAVAVAWKYTGPFLLGVSLLYAASGPIGYFREKESAEAVEDNQPKSAST